MCHTIETKVEKNSKFLHLKFSLKLSSVLFGNETMLHQDLSHFQSKNRYFYSECDPEK